ncbi:ABC transporter ATP-binding protein [Kordiimonas marina]|uniref:ABC transporter ATP-binding protein n=1 Tax=Kordiimonas marina TaxID=2872312 RepID=UPI001FF40656|nr:ABC transporter ATP-binding protein [Kordiimonas marina]MCJ9429424.1 ABC transporter ATP-binding protein [Kordiimonas marina]
MTAATASAARADDPLAIDVHGLVKSFDGKVVVDDFSLAIPEGKIFGFLGPNGSGKTTTLRMLCGLLTPDSGEGTCLGLDLRDEAPLIKRQTGYMTQKFSLYEDLTIKENLDFVARLYEMDRRTERVEESLKHLGLYARRDQQTGTLSGGWKQRLALAACTLHEPRLLLLDEPTAGVDPNARREFWDEIHALAETGITVLVSTHYMDEAERCHEIVYLAYGKLLAKGTIANIIDNTALYTWRANGKNADRLASKLRGCDGVEMAVAFGADLHVSGTDEAALEAAIAPYRHEEGIEWFRHKPTLEDVFIHLTAGSKDNFS